MQHKDNTRNLCKGFLWLLHYLCISCQLDIEGKNHDTSLTQTLHVSLFIDGMGSIRLIIYDEYFEKKNNNYSNVELCQVTPGIVFRYCIWRLNFCVECLEVLFCIRVLNGKMNLHVICNSGYSICSSRLQNNIMSVIQ